MKRYYKTKHGTYVPTLREYWKPGMTRRDLSSAASKRRWWHGFSLPSLVKKNAAEKLTVAKLVFLYQLQWQKKTKLNPKAPATVADGHLFFLIFLLIYEFILAESHWFNLNKWLVIVANTVTDNGPCHANETYFKLLLYSLLVSKDQTVSGLSPIINFL